MFIASCLHGEDLQHNAVQHTDREWKYKLLVTVLYMFVKRVRCDEKLWGS